MKWVPEGYAMDIAKCCSEQQSREDPCCELPDWELICGQLAYNGDPFFYQKRYLQMLHISQGHRVRRLQNETQQQFYARCAELILPVQKCLYTQQDEQEWEQENSKRD